MKYGVKWETVGRGESRGGSATPKQGHAVLKESCFGWSGRWEGNKKKVGSTNRQFEQGRQFKQKLNRAEGGTEECKRIMMIWKRKERVMSGRELGSLNLDKHTGIRCRKEKLPFSTACMSSHCKVSMLCLMECKNKSACRNNMATWVGRWVAVVVENTYH